MTPAEHRDGPYTVARGHRETERWYLTHVDWHPNNWWGDIPQPETGVRPVRDGKPLFGAEHFQLIQHGWPNFSAAERVILPALDKGWDAARICTLMDGLKARRSRSIRAANLLGGGGDG